MICFLLDGFYNITDLIGSGITDWKMYMVFVSFHSNYFTIMRFTNIEYLLFYIVSNVVSW